MYSFVLSCLRTDGITHQTDDKHAFFFPTHPTPRHPPPQKNLEIKSNSARAHPTKPTNPPHAIPPPKKKHTHTWKTKTNSARAARGALPPRATTCY